MVRKATHAILSTLEENVFNCLLTLHIIYISLPKSSNCRNGLDGCHGSCWEMTSVEEPPTQQEATGSTRSPPHRGYGQYTGSTRSPPTQQEAPTVRGALSSSYCPQPEEPPTQQEATGRRPWSERPCGRCRSPPHSKRLRAGGRGASGLAVAAGAPHTARGYGQY